MRFQPDLFDSPPSHPPLIVSYGMGVDSTAILVEFHNRGIRPDLILFADTGSEKPETYAYRSVIDEFLTAVGFPPIVVVRYVVQRPRKGSYSSLHEECLVHAKLPGLAYGTHSCAAKWKAEPQEKFIHRWHPARTAWRFGLKVRQVIGFEAGKEVRRCNRLPNNDLFEYWTPLIEWGWDRDRCIEAIQKSVLLGEIASHHRISPVPVKSACFMCPASKPEEVLDLSRNHPDLLDLALEMERRAAPNLRSSKGLFRSATKTRPGSWTEFMMNEEKGDAGDAH